ncbi:protein of unknown function [Trichlorobacter ammonificans]|uniref:Uncharacterized protein n=1 Tax=Trichlorobacter ammonificans TaxID=2916410 RepID=A0ABN8HIB1_9BACT|nr:protein of unknown function [Trichlorobacter ammonificans]
MDAAAGHVEFTGAAGPRPYGNADVERKGEADNKIGHSLQFHVCMPPLFFVNVKFLVEVAHQLGENKDDGNKRIYGTLMREPEAERVASQMYVVESLREQDAASVGYQEPHDEHSGQ